MAGYLGTKAVLLSTTAADVVGNAEIGGDLTVGGAFTSQGIDDNASATAMTLDASGNVGIGIGSPSNRLSLLKGVGYNSDSALFMDMGVNSEAVNNNATYNWRVGLTGDASGHSYTFSTIGRTQGSYTERMRIDSSGNVGIGTSSPAADYKLDVNGAFTVGGDYNESTSTNGGGVNIGFNSTTGGNITSLDPAISWYPISIGASELKFNGFGLERMRIDALGNVLVGTPSAGFSAKNYVVSSTNAIAAMTTAPADTYEAFVGARNGNAGKIATWWYNSSSQVGNISITSSSTAYNTSSDYRLKTDAQPMTGASARVQALNPVNFEWLADGTRVDGFLAHEAQEVVPEAVTGTKDAMRDEEYEVTPAVYEDVVIPAVLDEEGNELEAERTEQRLVSEAVMGTRSVPDYQGIDQSKLVPLLTAALQEALTEIADLKARVTALEAV